MTMTILTPVRPRVVPPAFAVQVTADNIPELAAALGGSVVRLGTHRVGLGSFALSFDGERATGFRTVAYVTNWVIQYKLPRMLRDIEIVDDAVFAEHWIDTDIDEPAELDAFALDRAIAAEVEGDVVAYAVAVETSTGAIVMLRHTATSHPHAVGILHAAARKFGGCA